MVATLLSTRTEHGFYVSGNAALEAKLDIESEYSGLTCFSQSQMKAAAQLEARLESRPPIPAKVVTLTEVP